MKKFLTLIFLAGSFQFGMSQLDLRAHVEESEMVVTIPAHQTVEYRLNVVDPIAMGVAEVEFGKVQSAATATEVRWVAATGATYEFSYRYPTATGELSEWFTFDPNAHLSTEEK